MNTHTTPEPKPDEEVTIAVNIGPFYAESAGQPAVISTNPEIPDVVTYLVMQNFALKTYNLPPDAPTDLVDWQRRQLTTFLHFGPTRLHRALEGALDGFCMALWLRPGEAPPKPEEAPFWSQHAAAMAHTLGKPLTPQWWHADDVGVELAHWAERHAQRHTDAPLMASLTQRQRAALTALGIGAGHLLEDELVATDTPRPAASDPTGQTTTAPTAAPTAAATATPPWFQHLIGEPLAREHWLPSEQLQLGHLQNNQRPGSGPAWPLPT